MSNLEDYIIKDNETQYNKRYGYYKDMLFSIYGIDKLGILFERDLNNTKRILKHYSNGVKGIDYVMTDEDVFFRKNTGKVHFFDSHENYDDYSYSNEAKQLSKDEMIKVLKEYIYLHFPNIGYKTMMGWNRKDGDNSPIHDPNWYYASIQLDDKNDYTIIKRKDTVKLFKGEVDKFYFDDHDELAVVKFILERELYEKALKLSFLRSKISKMIFGKVDTSQLEEFINLKAEITANLK